MLNKSYLLLLLAISFIQCYSRTTTNRDSDECNCRCNSYQINHPHENNCPNGYVWLRCIDCSENHLNTARRINGKARKLMVSRNSARQMPRGQIEEIRKPKASEKQQKYFKHNQKDEKKEKNETLGVHLKKRASKIEENFGLAKEKSEIKKFNSSQESLDKSPENQRISKNEGVSLKTKKNASFVNSDKEDKASNKIVEKETLSITAIPEDINFQPSMRYLMKRRFNPDQLSTTKNKQRNTKKSSDVQDLDDGITVDSLYGRVLKALVRSLKTDFQPNEKALRRWRKPNRTPNDDVYCPCHKKLSQPRLHNVNNKKKESSRMKTNLLPEMPLPNSNKIGKATKDEVKEVVTRKIKNEKEEKDYEEEIVKVENEQEIRRPRAFIYYTFGEPPFLQDFKKRRAKHHTVKSS